MDIRSFIPTALLRAWSRDSDTLRGLRAAILERRGSLRWKGSLAVPELVETPRLSKEERLEIARAVLLTGTAAFKPGRLPSEEAEARALAEALGDWRQTVLRWQVVVEGEVSWSPEEAQAWKTALDERAGSWLFAFSRVIGVVRRLRGHLPYLTRKATFAIDNWPPFR